MFLRDKDNLLFFNLIDDHLMDEALRDVENLFFLILIVDHLMDEACLVRKFIK